MTMGYHLDNIPKGVLGELSKVQEELWEAEDANRQGARIMLLVELSDMVGAIEAVLSREFPGFSLYDLIKMASLTKRSFLSGERK